MVQHTVYETLCIIRYTPKFTLSPDIGVLLVLDRPLHVSRPGHLFRSFNNLFKQEHTFIRIHYYIQKYIISVYNNVLLYKCIQIIQCRSIHLLIVYICAYKVYDFFRVFNYVHILGHGTSSIQGAHGPSNGHLSYLLKRFEILPCCTNRSTEKVSCKPRDITVG